MTNAANERALKRARQSETREQEQRVNDALHVMSSDPGRRFVYRMVYEICGLESPVGLGSELVMAHNVGIQEIGKNLTVFLREACPQQWLLMLAEYEESLRQNVQPEEDQDV